MRWVLAGTGNVGDDDPPLNTGVLLDAKTGETITRQSKQFRFDLDAAQQTGAYCFAAFQPPVDMLYEDIEVKRALHVVKLGAMRLAILICEDVAHLSGLLPTVHHNGVSHVLTPVFAKPMRYWFWGQQAAEALQRRREPW